MRAGAIGAAALATLVLASSCGGTPAHRPGATINVLATMVPASLDPAVAYGPRAMEADWLAYTPLLSYAHSRGVTGTRLIPGLATDLPTISDGGTTYRFTLRTGLVYSSGEAVRASDFPWAVERAIRLGWPGSRAFIVRHVVGAAAFADRRAGTISGIAADDASGQITIRLTSAYGQFDDVLALPALAPVPRSTPLRDERFDPPAGVGPYRITSVIPARSYSLLRNPGWATAGIPGIPAGHADIRVTAATGADANALAVLGGRADAADPADPISPAVLARAEARAADGLVATAADGSYAILVNIAGRPFSSAAVREAVAAGLDRRTIERLAGGLLAPGCYPLAPPMSGHPSAPCPQNGDIARARALVGHSGLAGARISVFNQARPALDAVMSYCLSLLDRIGLRAAAVSAPGSADLTIALISPRLPNPAAVYEQLGSITGDPHLATQLHLLGAVPTGQLTAVSSLWSALDEYTVSKAYLAVLGYPRSILLVSSRIDPSSVILHPVAYVDWSSISAR